ncbi:MAG: FAD:protein FMN transferase [Elusimicrobia bacterium]|nr:FAD:protein FMN transferase [Elusimicrobiota bacterium]
MSIRFLNIIALLIIFLSVSCAQKPEYGFYQKQKMLMGTIFKIKVFADKKKLNKKSFNNLAEKAFDEVSRLEREMSEWRADSPISKAAINAGIKHIAITPDIARVIDMALDISSESGGVFDISFKPLGRLWNIKKRKIPPSKKEIKKALAFVNYKNIVLDKKGMTLFLKKKGMHIGLGGIAKGYAAGRAGDILKLSGIDNFIINAGGDLFVSGNKNGEYWTSGIKNPEGGLFFKFKIKNDCAVVTSGDYERFFVYKGKRYHHIIDVRTGYPAEGLKSVTVISENPALADAYATSFFIMGYEKALEIVKKKKGLNFIMIDSGSNILKSPDIKNAIEVF